MKDFTMCQKYHAIAIRTYQSNQTIQSLPTIFGCEERQNIPSSCVHSLDIISPFLLQPYLDQTYARVPVGPYLLEQFYTMFHCLYETELSAKEKMMTTSLWRVQT